MSTAAVMAEARPFEVATSAAPEELPRLIGEWSAAIAEAQRRLFTPPVSPHLAGQARDIADDLPLSTEEFAARVGCSAWYIKELVHRRKVTPIVVGGGRHGHFRFEPSDVDRIKTLLKDRRRAR